MYICIHKTFLIMKEKEEERVTLDSYYIPQKVKAFANSFVPCYSESLASEVFTDAKLRRYFQAFPIPSLGDLLIVYLNALEQEGFLLQTSVTGEPAIFVQENHPHQGLLPGLTSCDNEERRGGEVL